jgi:hypothetical protein
MPVNPDFKDLFVALNAAGARFLLVGGYALARSCSSLPFQTSCGSSEGSRG